MTDANYVDMLRRRCVALVAIAALTLALVLAGCGGRGAYGQNNAGRGGMSTGTSSSGSLSSSVSVEVQEADQYVQSALGGLDSAENGATDADNTSQEGTTLP
ncbi:MAG: hypothetical protein ACXWQR_02425 [Ktedonobacterales bacterium]